MKLRINESKEVLYNFPFTDSKDVYNKMKEYSKADREMFMVMYLNAKNHVIDCELHSIGMVDSAAVYPREVMRGALLANACAIICVHNHPSGDVTPSGSDNEITGEIVKAGIILQVNVLDHIIIGSEGYYSYADEGKLGDMEHEAGKAPCQGHVAEEDNDKEFEFGECLECHKAKEYETDIELCETCMKKFDVDKLWRMHDNRELDALDFNENPFLREMLRLKRGVKS